MEAHACYISPIGCRVRADHTTDHARYGVVTSNAAWTMWSVVYNVGWCHATRTNTGSSGRQGN